MTYSLDPNISLEKAEELFQKAQQEFNNIKRNYTPLAFFRRKINYKNGIELTHRIKCLPTVYFSRESGPASRGEKESNLAEKIELLDSKMRNYLISFRNVRKLLQKSRLEDALLNAGISTTYSLSKYSRE